MTYAQLSEICVNTFPVISYAPFLVTDNRQ